MLAGSSFSTLWASYIPFSLYFGGDGTECISPCFPCSSSPKRPARPFLKAFQENTAWHPSRYTNAWIVAAGGQISNARAEVESPQTRPLNAAGIRGEYTHDYHTRCDFALGCAWCIADMAVQLRVGLLPERWPRPRRSDPRDTAAAWAHITIFDAERERTRATDELLLARRFAPRFCGRTQSPFQRIGDVRTTRLPAD